MIKTKNPVLLELFDNMESTSRRRHNNDADLLSLGEIEAILSENHFVFLLFGSNEFKSNSTIVQSIIEFWKQFHKKHKFIVVYLEFNSRDDRSSSGGENKKPLSTIDLSSVDWFTVSKKDIKVII
jgi:hypothetical protein